MSALKFTTLFSNHNKILKILNNSGDESNNNVHLNLTGLMKKNILLLLILCVSFDLQAKDLQYFFPLPNTEFHNPSTELIFTFDENVSINNINKQAINLWGDKSGRHTFDIKIAGDGKTLLVKPHNAFLANEKVEVNITSLFNNDTFIPLNYKFKVDNKQNNTKNSRTEFEEPYFKQMVVSEGETYFKDYKTALEEGTLPPDFPTFDVTVNNKPKDGYMLVAPRAPANGKFGNYLVILDKDGKPFKYRETTPGTFNFKQQANGYYIAAENFGSHYDIPGNGTKMNIRIFNKDLNLIDFFQMGNGYIAGPHEFMIQPNGNYLCLAQSPHPMDMSKIVEGGNPSAFIVGNVIQEYDKDKNVIFQWRAIDHIDLKESYLDLTAPVISYAHINAVEVDRDGNWLISARHCASIMKIDRKTGEIMWRMGGKKNEFTFFNDEKDGPEYFSYQHDIRRLKNGDITFFDNGNLRTNPYSRGVRYTIDENLKTATLVWSYRNSPDVYGPMQGSVQTFDDNSYLIGWGSPTKTNQTAITEINSAGEKTFELSFPDNFSNYRVQKVAYPPCPAVADVSKEELLQLNTYKFNTTTQKTGILMQFNVLNVVTNYNTFYVRKFDCAPIHPAFEDKVYPMIIAHRIEFESVAIKSYEAEVSLDMNEYQNTFDLIRPTAYYRSTIGEGVFKELTSTYNPDTKVLTFTLRGDGEVVLGQKTNRTLTPTANLISPPDGSIIDAESLNTLTWNNNSEFFQNNVYINELDVNGNVVNTYGGLLTESRYFINPGTLKENTKYSWQVIPQYINGGNASQIWTFETKPKFINVLTPNGGEQMFTEQGKFIIRWENNFTDTVKIEVLKGGELFKTLAESNVCFTNNYWWTIDGSYTPGDDYKIRITSLPSGLISESKENFSINKLTSINEENLLSNKVYPNPATNKISYIFDTKEIVNAKNVEIYNNNGNKLKDFDYTNILVNNNRIELSIENLAKGVYFIKVTLSGNKQELAKFVKQ